MRLRVDAQVAEFLALDNGSGASSGEESAPGFGLLGIRERIALLGGTSSIGPEPGEGWRVEVTLPLGRNAPESGAKLATQERWSMDMPLQPSDDAPMRVLMVDDQTLLRQSFQRLLELSDITCRSSARRRMA